ncbi:Dabb family protein [Acetobacter okinawensis]|uniref:Dabb family protein n=1 Tax=Acetobacter okinawensis TaxID=1076594 RepID=UPI001BAACCFD|nr:Dabb family protein [Acetobacter okinawensis]MBS0964639.1 Dabb family protein [Acetobacter okinawensis]MBS0988076.1 Dabb family protein [Acetobacter okinawensis]
MLKCSVVILCLGAVSGTAFIHPENGFAQNLPVSQTAQLVRADARSVGDARFTAPDYKPGIVRHMVMFRFKPQVTQAERDDVTKRFVALAQLSRRPDGRAVVASIEAGPQISGENVDFGLEQGYLVTFHSQGDRNFYVGRPIVTDSRYFDPAHDAFKSFAGPYLERVAVFDFPVEVHFQP